MSRAWRRVEPGEAIASGDRYMGVDGMAHPVPTEDVGKVLTDSMPEILRRMPMPEEGRKDDTGKLPWDILPVESVEEIIEALQFGAQKYGAYNWQKVERPFNRYFAALCRHIFAWWKGEETDQESGKHHLAHAGCCILFLLWFARNATREIGAA